MATWATFLFGPGPDRFFALGGGPGMVAEGGTPFPWPGSIWGYYLVAAAYEMGMWGDVKTGPWLLWCGLV
ncbi:MAG: hypothetical protein CM15mP18_5140 [Methanobacteriota archaeon]|nr:MAG: hypothetical protein CM15mP18_5140 [Euryarchaeota archaeon]